MGKIYVTKGKEVDVNDLLGEVGMTGHTTGPHTHLEISYSEFAFFSTSLCASD
jgi:murein DD-endopeptidase MepM/ murein hydrolase activator NlpD